jgi:hypothetical protein
MNLLFDTISVLKRLGLALALFGKGYAELKK